MNAYDYFFENTFSLTKKFLVGREEITYRELHKCTLDLSEWIMEKVGENRKIFLVSPNNLFFLKVYLAVIKSGNICIPLDPNIEIKNFNYINELTNPELIFITSDVYKKLNLNIDIAIFPDKLDSIPTANRKPQTANPEQFDIDRCAEIIFTSGSTGEPKGVMISHKNLIANTRSIVDYLKLTEDDRMMVVLPFYYCYGLSLLHTHLRIGGSIVFNNSFIFLGSVIKDMIEHKCTGFAGIPSHFQILLRKSDSFKQTRFPHMRYVTQAGGKLAPIFIDEFRQSHPEITFIVMYGQTEATARLSWLPPELYESKKGSIGKGIPDVILRVVNENDEDIKPGETGEVIARGDNIMMGYFGDEAATKKAIRNGWLYTGDLGTVDEDGYIFLTARSKEMIKVGGKRISPKEIEAVILHIPEVVDCTIEGIEDPIQGEALKATVVVRKGSLDKITEDFIRHHCAQHLALFKVPQFYLLKDELTITATGKKIKKT